MRKIENSFYRSKAWRECRESYIKYRGGYCERCYKQGLFEKADIVHHKIELNDDNINNPSISLNFDNLELVCRSCHNKIHFRNPKRYIVDENGHVSSNNL